MHRTTFKNSRQQTLAGRLYTAKSDAIVIMSHGFTSDKSEGGKFDKMAESLNQSGFNALTFDFSGCGESDDDTLTVEKQIDDLKSAIDFVKSKGYKKIGLLGCSLGGLISLKCFTSEIITMVLWAPATNKLPYDWSKRFSAEQMKELDEKGYLTVIRDKGIRKKIQIHKQILTDIETIDQKNALKNVSCPILIIHGTNDGAVPHTDSEKAMKLLSKDSKLELIENAGHGFKEHTDVIIELSNNWFTKSLS